MHPIDWTVGEPFVEFDDWEESKGLTMPAEAGTAGHH